MHAEFQDVSKKDIHRLVTTEFGHINEEATAKGYEESGIDQYEYMATLESHTCMVCAHLDGQIFKTGTAKRGFYNESRGELRISGFDAIDKQITTYHELGYRIEDLNPEIHNLLLEFYDRRTANDEVVKLSDLTGNKDYTSDEVTRVDKFKNPYMGKDYGREGTELLSMSIEGLISGKYELEKDKDYATLILGILRTM